METISLYRSCPCPARSPWGAIQTKRELAPGIWTVSTAGHGGIKLSRERNAVVPEYMRSKGGWYEEDCQWAIAAVVHPIGFTRVCPTEGNPDRTEWDIANETLRHWYPVEYEQWAGVQLVAGESRTRDKRNFKADNESHFVVTSAWGSWAPWVPKGMVGVSAIRRSDDARKEFLVPAPEYESRTGFGFVINLSRHQETTIPEAG
jgi:hypothetical protein